ncbi:hypothetical protein EUX98_g6913 [Antrodiella citrinella]|uniref:Uncharacterized protein n=1 Tax=Antrodiella citrinella TaxID=2447956 RepID=A0A4S4MNM9_9APHY|nr:hypothetical protein EUX98_g6913 [Antrodiella citrinella]
MPVLQDAHMPTHVLAITDTAVHPNLQPNPVPIHPILAPINAELFATKFTNDVAKLSSHYTTPGTLMPIPYWDKTSQSLEVTLPLIPLVAPHPESLPLLIFYGMSLHHTYEPAVPPHPPSPGSPQEHQFPGFSKRRSHDATPLACSCTGLLATYLLPTSVIEEFPAANVMAAKMSDLCTDEQLDAYMDFNRGFWRNVLSLAPTDMDIIDIARIAWNVTKEARWIRASRGEFESGSGRRPSVSSLAPPPSPL